MFRSLMIAAAVTLATSGAAYAGGQTAHKSESQYDRGATAEEAYSSPEQKRRYEEKVKRQLSQWSDKVEAYYDQAKREGRNAAGAAEQRLDQAWTDVERGWEALQDASGEAWQESRNAFQKTWQKFKRTWAEVTSREG